MPQCKYHETCGRDVEDNSAEGLCIFHSTDPAKDADAFAEALVTHRTRKGDHFRRFVFPGRANFRKAMFTEDADFYQATFTREADFTSATFYNGVNFNGASFGAEASFNDATFGATVNFNVARFDAAARFTSAKFNGIASFTGTMFSARVYFMLATFSEVAHFVTAKFNGIANFNSVTFSGVANFSGAKFLERADFRWATFSGRTHFAGPEGSDRTGYIFAGAEVDFRQVVINSTDAVAFEQADVRKCQFQGTDLRKVRLVGVEWPQKGGRFLVYEEIAIVQDRRRWVLQWLLWGVVVISLLWTGIANLRRHLGYGGSQPWSSWFDIATGWGIWVAGIVIGVVVVRRIGGWIDRKLSYKPPWPQIERLYRELKQNYEDRRDYERAGDFHYGEKEMRRRNPDTAWGLWVFLMLYWLFSGYGERYRRPLIWAGFLFIGSTMGYMWWGLRLKDGSSSLAWTYPWVNPWDWLRAAHYSFQVMTLLKPDDWVPLRYAKVINTFQTLLGPTFLGLFALALRQRLKR